MKVFYSSRYTVELPDGHRFPMRKYRMIRDALVDEGLVEESQIHESPEVALDDLYRTHAAEFVDAFLTGTLDRRALRRIGFPWSTELVGRILTTVGGSVAAAHAALDDGIACNLAGGTHHAGRHGGEGFCVFNDAAVAAMSLLESGRVGRLAILDLDVHQGNGNSELLGCREGVFIASVHGEKNYPFHKTHSHVDVGLPDGSGDETFLLAVDVVLAEVLAFEPDLVLYQAGVDGLASDSLGRLGLTHEGLRRRDEKVLGALHNSAIPVALALGGGYADPIEDTVEAHRGTYRVVRELYG